MPVDASLTRRAQTIIYLDTRNNSEGLLRASVFWSGLLGAEIPTISPPVSSGPGSPIRVLTLAQSKEVIVFKWNSSRLICVGIDLYSGLPFQKDSHVTSVTILMKKILAAGMGNLIVVKRRSSAINFFCRRRINSSRTVIWSDDNWRKRPRKSRWRLTRYSPKRGLLSLWDGRATVRERPLIILWLFRWMGLHVWFEVMLRFLIIDALVFLIHSFVSFD